MTRLVSWGFFYIKIKNIDIWCYTVLQYSIVELLRGNLK